MSTIRRKDGDTSKPLPNWAKGVCSAIKLGDKVATVATPVARVLGLSCIDKETKQLRLDSRCAKKKRLLNGES